MYRIKFVTLEMNTDDQSTIELEVVDKNTDLRKYFQLENFMHLSRFLQKLNKDLKLD